MAITAKRFDNLNKQTNVAVIDFIDSKSSKILNNTKGGVQKASDALGKIASGNGLDGIKKALEKVDSSGIFGDTRLATDGLSSVMSLANEAKQTLDKVTETYMPVLDSAMNTYKTVSQEVKEAVSLGMAIKDEVESKITMGKQILDVAKSGDIKNIKDLKNLSEKIKSSGMLESIKDTSRLQNLVSSVSQKAHDYNIPNYFSDVSSVFTKAEDMVKPANETIQYGCSRSDMNGVMDVLKSDAAPFVSPFNPSTTDDIFTSYKKPIEISDSKSSGFFDDFTDVIGKASDTWDKVQTQYREIKSSIASVVNKSGEWVDTIESKVNNEPVEVTESTDEVIKVEEEDYLAGHYSVSNTTTATQSPQENTLESVFTQQSLPVASRPSAFTASLAKFNQEWGVVFDEPSMTRSNRIAA